MNEEVDAKANALSMQHIQIKRHVILFQGILLRTSSKGTYKIGLEEKRTSPL